MKLHANIKTSKASIPGSLLPFLDGPQRETSTFFGPCGGKTGAAGGKEKVEGGGLRMAMGLAIVHRAVLVAPWCHNGRSDLKPALPRLPDHLPLPL